MSIPLSELSIETRLQLIGDLWDSIVDEGDGLPVPQDHRKEIADRLAAYELDGDPGQPASRVLKRIRRGA